MKLTQSEHNLLKKFFSHPCKEKDFVIDIDSTGFNILIECDCGFNNSVRRMDFCFPSFTSTSELTQYINTNL